MALILNIDSSTSQASVCLALDGNPAGQAENGDQKDHSSWLHIAIQDLFGKTSFKLNQLQAVAVTSGPGSYTGLRVGMSAAKGLCYALNIPLITENTLRIMAMAVLE
ncbi:MAG TPA: tRNA (adenosine(37)-N6)-threonylcarbamoyltransferase complex dimerization subunit type 1 TsaB, partial [Puia sp.]|nr:tRNA (adenosine(37)-N6)-threonylcarbamoyltransferase complex dimerization subunit type 1 TsaB [Puia sp.]